MRSGDQNRDGGGEAWTSYYRGMALANPHFDTYRLTDEHAMLRQSVRQLAEDKIAPYAAEVDEDARFPHEAHDALVQAGFQAVHIPEQYGGARPRAVAPPVVVPGSAPGCASALPRRP